MKRQILPVFICLIIVQPLFSNDTHIKIGAGGIGYFSSKEDENISLEKELLTITFYDQYYSVEVNYLFKNQNKEDLIYDIGFPVISNDVWKIDFLPEQIPLDGFLTTVNGETVAFQETEKSEDEKIYKWYTKQVVFKGNSENRISINYSSKYGQSGGLGDGTIAYYFYGSAYIWKGKIKELKIRLINKSNLYIYSFQEQKEYIEKPKISIEDEITTLITYESIKPKKDSTFIIKLAKMDGFWMWSLDSTKNYKLKTDEFLFATLTQLRILRNMFYAANGLRFNSKDLYEFFDKFPWYNIQADNVDDKLDDSERKAIAIIQSLETRRKQGENIPESGL